jgi:hypothetical protein
MFSLFNKKNSDNSNEKPTDNKQALNGFSEIVQGEKDKRAAPVAGLGALNIFGRSSTKADDSKWSAPKIIKTNLIQDENESFIELKGYLAPLSIRVVITVVAIIVIYVGLIFWENRIGKESVQLDLDNTNLWNQITTKEKEIENADIMRQKTETASTLLENHIYWSNFFNLLEGITLPDVVYLGGFSGKVDGDFALNAETKDYRRAAEQLAVFRNNPKVLSAEVGSIQFSAEKEEATTTIKSINSNVSFNIQFKLDQNIFNNRSKTSK